MTEAYPLSWPDGWPRTRYPQRSRFDTSADRARRKLFDELRLLRAKGIILSTNQKLRLDGMPYASGRAPDDPGVAVYFTLKRQSMVLACDKWDLMQDNFQSIAKTVEAMRGIERWGSSEILKRAFTGFAALPPPGAKSCWDILGIESGSSADAIKDAYRRKARNAHPDSGGSDAVMAELNVAKQEALSP